MNGHHIWCATLFRIVACRSICLVLTLCIVCFVFCRYLCKVTPIKNWLNHNDLAVTWLGNGLCYWLYIWWSAQWSQEVGNAQNFNHNSTVPIAFSIKKYDCIFVYAAQNKNIRKIYIWVKYPCVMPFLMRSCTEINLWESNITISFAYLYSVVTFGNPRTPALTTLRPRQNCRHFVCK